MRKNKILKLTALVLSAVMLAGVGYTALPVEAEDTISGSYYNFEDGDTSVYSAYYGVTNENSINLVTYEDTKAIVPDNTSTTRRCIVFEPSSKNVFPSNVSFCIKFDGIGATTTDAKGLFEFLPIKSSVPDMSTANNVKNHYNRECQITFRGRYNPSNAKQDLLILRTYGQDGGTYKSDTTISKASEIDGKWLEYNFSYNWDNYTEANGWKVTLALTIKSEGETIATLNDITFAPGTTSTTYPAYITNQSHFGVAFGWGRYALDTGITVALDNVGITWTDGTNTYAPTYIPEPKALGATLATTEGTDGTIKTQMGFKFTDARTALEKNGETVSEYGAVFVAGTKDYETMKTNAASVIGGTAVDGYVRAVKAEADLPDEYRVTITNSDGDNIGKRVTAIGYVKTTDGTIYYTGENTSDDIVQANLNNYSVMSTLKNIFAKTYLADTANGTDSDGDGMIDEITADSKLANAIASYNSIAKLADIKEAIANGLSTGNTTNGLPKRELLKSIHFALYNSYQ